MKKKIKIITAAVAVVLVLLFAGMSGFIGIQVFSGSTQLTTNRDTAGISDTFQEKFGMNYEEFCRRYTVEPLKIESTFDGHMIPADYIYAEHSENSKNRKTVILVHGLGGNRYTNYPVAEMFLEQGYNVLTFDQRSSNENTAKYTTFGYWEKFDLIDYINYVKAQAPNEAVGIWGTSFGGATAGLAAGYEDTQSKINFLILDCPVSNMKWMVEEEIKKMDIGIPVSYMTWCGNLVNKLKLGFTYDEADVCRAVSGLDIPVLIINSRADTVTPYFMGKDLYDSFQGENKMILTFSDSEHTEMWLDDNSGYREGVSELLSAVQ